ncbi:MAG: type VI secretion system-associated FHA domain protein TagH [Burkholderiaceae bacterium]|nr:type VI secretion system-associated FHA domain protein TagH [Burkholderiaceae bacterium]
MAMTLTLVAVSLNDQPLSQPITAVFDARGGTIGRADHNTMALPDPQRHVSRLQAEVVAHDQGFMIRNVGSANPIVVGTRSLGSSETCALAHGDTLRVGPYVLKAQLGTAQSEAPTRPGLQRLSSPPTPARPMAPPAAPAPAAAPTALAPPTPLSGNAFADLLGTPGVSSDNPFADLLGGAPAAAGAAPQRAAAPADSFADLMPPPAGVAARSAAVAPQPPAPARLPDDFDPFAAPPAKPVSAAATVDPFADLMPAAAAPSIDALFDLGAPSPAAQDDPLARFMGGAAAPASSAPAVSADPLAMFAPAPSPAPAAPPQADRLSALHDAWQPPRQAAPPPPATSEAPTRVPDTAAAPQAALWAAFCEGAGITSTLPAGGLAQRLREIGLILRSAIDGTLQLIAVRASTKHELRAGMTVIRQVNNNPLKFSPDAKAGLEQLLQPPLRGFLDGPAAMNDAMQDLVGHSIGTVAGMRAAVEGMLDRFAPEALERKLVGTSMLDSLLPMNRKARLWDLYLQHHDAIRAEAQEDFHTLFGKAFLAAYEQQVERLRRDASGRK